MSRTLLTALAATVLFAASLSAQAQTKAEQVSTSVFYGDLDLSKPAGMQTLRGRLKAASLQVCGDTRGALRVNRSDPAQCSHDAMTNALRALAKTQNQVVAVNGSRPAN